LILTGNELQEQNVVSNVLSPLQFQPCGVDLTLKEVHEFASPGKIDYDNKERELSQTKRIIFPSDEWLHLPKGAYKIVYSEIVKIPADCCALGFTRSSLLRCGASIECAVWDPGYEGRSESLLIVDNPQGIKLKKYSRVLQLVFVKLTNHAKETYSGAYHKENIG